MYAKYRVQILKVSAPKGANKFFPIGASNFFEQYIAWGLSSKFPEIQIPGLPRSMHNADQYRSMSISIVLLIQNTSQ